ncbi:Fic family protein [Streptomyces inhibens]|uniref:Fic family protein n=1 Tax=Streptomyces inhibens TaxID=2293571 RepID=UPI001EE6DFB3|nr:Fic family protein [Streptomyces inhibens]UKY48220.1 Fic family protein [Streptomyces inhibens]
MTAADADALADWCRVRQQVDWARTGAEDVTGPVTPSVDGFTAWCEGPVRRRDPARAERLLSAYAAARADAARNAPLTFGLLAGWQRLVLGTAEAPFRTGDAYAKGGRERYRLTPRTEADFARCLRGSDEKQVPPAARAARTYLDVAFFHPFADGNGRAALLALTFVLAREGIVLDEVGPLQTTRYADDPGGAADLAVLVGILIRATRGRAFARQPQDRATTAHDHGMAQRRAGIGGGHEAWHQRPLSEGSVPPR